MTKRIIWMWVPLAALALSTAACDDLDIDMGGGGGRVEAPFHYSYDVRPGARLDLETFNGSVEIRSWDQNKVDVAGTKYANSEAVRDSIRIDAHGSSDSVSVRAVRPSGVHNNIGVKFVVRVPKQITLDRITSSNGAIHVSDVDGSVNVKSSNGALNLTQIGGPVEAETSNGGIDLTDVHGNANLHTSNGHIHADHVAGVVEATSSNGNITLALVEPPKSEIRATTSNSSIEISMPAASHARIRANTSNGSIHSDFDISRDGSESKTHLEGALNGGGPLVDLSTSNGSIKLSRP